MGAALSGQEFEYLDGSQSFKTDLAARLCTICRPAAVIFLAYLINKLSEQKTAHIIDTFAQCLSKLQNMLGVHCALSASGDNN